MVWWRQQRDRASWESELQLAGVPSQFIEALRSFERLGKANPWPWLPILLLGERNADLYHLDAASAFAPRVAGTGVVPVFAEENNDAFILLVVEDDGSRRFVRVGTEEGVMEDFGPDFRAVLAGLVIDVWEAEAPDADVRRFADSIGFSECGRLLEELARTDGSTAEEDVDWRRGVVGRVLARR